MTMFINSVEVHEDGTPNLHSYLCGCTRCYELAVKMIPEFSCEEVGILHSLCDAVIHLRYALHSVGEGVREERTNSYSPNPAAAVIFNHVAVRASDILALIEEDRKIKHDSPCA